MLDFKTLFSLHNEISLQNHGLFFLLIQRQIEVTEIMQGYIHALIQTQHKKVDASVFIKLIGMYDCIIFLYYLHLQTLCGQTIHQCFGTLPEIVI